jgi:hypothetical protein
VTNRNLLDSVEGERGRSKQLVSPIVERQPIWRMRGKSASFFEAEEIKKSRKKETGI